MLKRVALLAHVLILLSMKGTEGAVVGNSYYCVQVLSSVRVTEKEKITFRELSRTFNEVRIEKIGKYYTLRVGFWDEIGKARKALNELRKLGFKKAFLRKCYFYPKRWILPKKEVPHPSKQEGRNKQRPIKAFKEKPYESRRLYSLVESLTKDINKNEKGVTEEETYKVNFPETRKGKRKEKNVKLSVGTSINRELSKSYTFTQLSYKGVGVKVLRKGEENKLGVAVKEFFKEKWIKDTVLLKGGIIRRENFLEAWSPISLEASTDFVDKKFSISLSYQGFRNYENQLNLRGLLAFNSKLNYYFTNTSGITVSYLYTKFTNGRKSIFSTGSRFNLKGWKENFSSFVSLRGNSYFLQMEKEFKGINLNVFTDKSLSFPPQAKGNLYFGRWITFFSIDPMNLTGARVTLPVKNFSFISSIYLTDGKGKRLILGEKKFKSKSKFVGLDFSLKYRLKVFRENLNFGGGIFLPGSAFEDRKPRTGGYLDVKVSW